GSAVHGDGHGVVARPAGVRRQGRQGELDGHLRRGDRARLDRRTPGVFRLEAAAHRLGVCSRRCFSWSDWASRDADPTLTETQPRGGRSETLAAVIVAIAPPLYDYRSRIVSRLRRRPSQKEL